MSVDWSSTTRRTKSPAPAAGFEEIAADIANNPRLLTDDRAVWNTPAACSAELAMGGIATARAMARFYACLAAGGSLEGVRILQEETVKLGRTPLVDETNVMWGMRSSYGVGFQLRPDPLPGYPRVPDWFGHGGFGGSDHGAWPSLRLACSYIPNRMRQDPEREPDGIGPSPRLLSALVDCLRAEP